MEELRTICNVLGVNLYISNHPEMPHDAIFHHGDLFIKETVSQETIDVIIEKLTSDAVKAGDVA